MWDKIPELTALLVFSFLVLSVCRKAAPKWGLMDRPSGRKQHQGEIPLVGGVSICVSMLVFLMLNPVYVHQNHVFVVCILVLVVTGVLDDKYDVSFKKRLLIQAALTIAMMNVAGLKLHQLGSLFFTGNVELGFLSYSVTLLAVLGAINAFNMVDGIDGLLGGLSAVSFGSLGVLLLLSGQLEFAYFCLVMVVTMLPYIAMNLGLLGKKRKVFMGDAGSMLIGFTLIWVILTATQLDIESSVRPVTALWIIALPLMDMVAIMIRRMRRGDSPFKPDREHLHHIFQRLGYSSRQTLGIICTLALSMSGFGIIAEIYLISDSVMLMLFVALLGSYVFALQHVWVISAAIRRRKGQEPELKTMTGGEQFKW
jgi:UDP-GlcNAc:undecaprenyl-phosphate GlcNAc-1-phosphate transferase